MKHKETRHKAWNVFAKYIKLKQCRKSTGSIHYGRCFTCGMVKERSELQAGHFIDGRHNMVLFDEKGVHIQCYKCNISLEGNKEIYERRMNEKYGKEFVERMKLESKRSRIYEDWEIEELIESWKEETLDLLKEE